MRVSVLRRNWRLLGASAIPLVALVVVSIIDRESMSVAIMRTALGLLPIVIVVFSNPMRTVQALEVETQSGELCLGERVIPNTDFQNAWLVPRQDGSCSLAVRRGWLRATEVVFPSVAEARRVIGAVGRSATSFRVGSDAVVKGAQLLAIAGVVAMAGLMASGGVGSMIAWCLCLGSVATLILAALPVGGRVTIDPDGVSIRSLLRTRRIPRDEIVGVGTFREASRRSRTVGVLLQLRDGVVSIPVGAYPMFAARAAAVVERVERLAIRGGPYR
jgi:hypothetical protein